MSTVTCIAVLFKGVELSVFLRKNSESDLKCRAYFAVVDVMTAIGLSEAHGWSTKMKSYRENLRKVFSKCGVHCSSTYFVELDKLQDALDNGLGDRYFNKGKIVALIDALDSAIRGRCPRDWILCREQRPDAEELFLEDEEENSSEEQEQPVVQKKRKAEKEEEVFGYSQFDTLHRAITKRNVEAAALEAYCATDAFREAKAEAVERHALREIAEMRADLKHAVQEDARQPTVVAEFDVNSFFSALL